MSVILISLFVIGWVAVSTLGTMAYFLGEQTKPIHERNWASKSFETLAIAITGTKMDYNDRVPAYGIDAYNSTQLPRA
jgi:hypothetical protein